MIRIPDERIEHLVLKNEYPEIDSTSDPRLPNPALEARILACEAVVARANADRAWARDRQRKAQPSE